MNNRKQSIVEARYIVSAMIVAARLTPDEKISERPTKQAIKNDITGLSGIANICMDLPPAEVIRIARFLMCVAHFTSISGINIKEAANRLKVDETTLNMLIKWIRA